MEKNASLSHTYVALLRGINVGGNKKVPMADLKAFFENAGYTGIRTILNSGNVVFESENEDIMALTAAIQQGLEHRFVFTIPVIIRPMSDFKLLIEKDPFKDIIMTKDIRLYFTFLPDNPLSKLILPYDSPDHSFRILSMINNVLCSVLDVSITKSTDAMNILDKEYGKNITTRNWNTVVKIIG